MKKSTLLFVSTLLLPMATQANDHNQSTKEKSQFNSSLRQDKTYRLAREIKSLRQQVNQLADYIEESPSSSEPSLHIGGYGELHFNIDKDSDNTVDFHRFVLLFEKQLSEKVQFVSELELEHSIAGEGESGEIELEQAYLKYDISRHHNTRMGLFLVPIGILNETHEPDTFYGVERNEVEKNIIPSSWWEAGVSLSGQLISGFHYDIAMHSGLDLSDDSGTLTSHELRDGRQKVSKALANKAAYTARLTYNAIPGLTVSTAINRQSDLTQGKGASPIRAILIESHIIYQTGILKLQALYAKWDIKSTINTKTSGSDKQTGGYVESSIKLTDRLGVFYRLSEYDQTANNQTDSEITTHKTGFNYWLADTAVIKFDYFDQENAETPTENKTGFNVGIGLSF